MLRVDRYVHLQAVYPTTTDNINFMGNQKPPPLINLINDQFVLIARAFILKLQLYASGNIVLSQICRKLKFSSCAIIYF